MGNSSLCSRGKSKMNQSIQEPFAEKCLQPSRADAISDMNLISNPNSNEDSSINESFDLDQNKLQLLEYLKLHPQISKLGQELLFKSLSISERITFKPQETIFLQGEQAKNIFILVQGRVEIFKDFIKIFVQNPVAILGQEGLTGKKRQLTVKTLQRSTFQVFDIQSIKKAIRSQRVRQYRKNTQFLKSLWILTQIQQVKTLGKGSYQFSCEAGSIFIQQGNTDQYIYFIKQGSVTSYKNNKIIKRLHQGQFFGEELLVSNYTKFTIIPEINTILLGVRVTDLKQVSLPFFFYQTQVSQVLLFHYPFLSKEQIQSILIQMKQESNPPITTKGIFVVLAGSLQSSDHQHRAISCIDNIKLGQHMASGQYRIKPGSLVFSASKQSFDQTFLDLKKLKFVRILRKLPFFNMLQDSHLKQLAFISETRTYANQLIFKQQDPAETAYGILKGAVLLYKQGQYRKKSCKAIGSAFQYPRQKFTCYSRGEATLLCIELAKMSPSLVVFISSQYFRDSSLKLNNLIPIKLLGQGGGGKVILAAHKETQKLFAIKITTNHPSFKSEGKLLRKLKHPMVMKLVNHLKTKEQIFLVTEYIKGTVFSDCIRAIQPLSLNQVKFYTACLILIVQYLHNKHIVYRDLKPENIMIDQEGYPKIVDFGTAKIVKGRTYSVVGTSVYLAPQVVNGQGHSFEVDWWSLGVIVYKLVTGKLPFGQKATDVQQVYEEILFKKVKFPIGLEGNFERFVLSLLNREPEKRSRCLTQEWVQDVNWDQIFLKTIVPPFIPRIESTESEVKAARAAGKHFQDFIKINLNQKPK